MLEGKDSSELMTSSLDKLRELIYQGESKDCSEFLPCDGKVVVSGENDVDGLVAAS